MSIPVKEAVDYIIKGVYGNKVIEPICKSKLIFCHLLDKLTQNSVFSVRSRLVTQLDGCSMEGAISVIMSGILMNRLEKEYEMPSKPKIYKRYIDNAITERKKNTDIGELFQNMNVNHANMKFTVETNPNRVTDTAFSKNLDGSVTTKNFPKSGKFPTFWDSQIPKRY